MQVDAQVYLRLLEKANKLVFVDIESTGLKGDYNSILCISLKPYKGKAYAFKCADPGDDFALVEVFRQEIQKFECAVTYYGKGFDWPMINTRLLRHGFDPLKPMHHIDLYFSLKAKLLTARKSQGHLLSWLETPEKKMSVSAQDWNRVLDPKTNAKAMETMVKRCNSDTTGLQALYERTSHLIGDIRRG